MVKRWWTLTLMAAAILLGNGLGADRPAIARLDAEARCVIFYEGNDCTQDRSSCCTEAGAAMHGCWENDEARSMKLHGPPVRSSRSSTTRKPRPRTTTSSSPRK
jgi:hypothetical protein